MLFQMKTLALEIPDSLLLQNAASLEDLGREAQVELAFHYFRTGRLSSGQAAQMAGMNRVDFLLAAGSRQIPLLDLDPEECKNEVAAAGL
jgi:predicted HTH domain antitoxin